MFGWNMEFRVVVNHIDAVARAIADLLRSFGIRVTNLREADIVADADGSIHGNVYILCCEGSRLAYRKFMKTYSFDEIMYEGVKTLM